MKSVEGVESFVEDEKEGGSQEGQSVHDKSIELEQRVDLVGQSEVEGLQFRIGGVTD